MTSCHHISSSVTFTAGDRVVLLAVEGAVGNFLIFLDYVEILFIKCPYTLSAIYEEDLLPFSFTKKQVHRILDGTIKRETSRIVDF